jgi:predicted O-methyltransferase YrrM
MPSVTRLVGIDLRVRNQGRLRAFARPGLELRFISASSMAESTYRQLEAALGGAPVDLLFIDGDHSFRGAAHDFREYRRLVAPGGLIAFHDIVPDNELRSGAESLAWAGEVPVLWELLRSQYRSHEFVESWDQEARGIGVLEYDPAIDTQLAPHRAAADRSGSE